MLTEDQKFIKLKDVMGQINKERKYYWIFHTEFNNVGKSVYSFAISIRDEMENNPEQSIVMMCRESTTPIYYFNCKDVDKELLEQIVPLIHHIAKLWFFNINHITRNDIAILDSILSEYVMSNDTTTLYQSQILFYPELTENEHIYELSKSNILPNFINKLSDNFIKDRVDITITNMKFTYDELIIFLLSLQWPIVLFTNCFILISKCLTNKLKRSITLQWVFENWKFESQVSIDGRNSFMYSISQNPYFFKSLTNFEIGEAFEGICDMSSSFLASNKSRSLIYRFVLEKLRELASLKELVRRKVLKKLKELKKQEEFENLEEIERQEKVSRLKELARREVLDYKYDKDKSLIEINILKNYYFGWMVKKERNVNINLNFWKFILAKIWSSFYHYLIFHRWYIPSKLESKIKKMMKYMKNYKHSKNIKIEKVEFDHKKFSKNLIDILFNLIAWSTFPVICLKIIYSDISNCLIKPFSKIMKLPAWSVQKVIIFDKNIIDYIDWENPSSKNYIKVMLTEYGVNYHTYVFYKFLENSWLLDSIKEIEFIGSLGIDFTALESLIVKYQSKHNIQWGISFKLRALSNSSIYSSIMVHYYFYSMVSNLIQFTQSDKIS